MFKIPPDLFTVNLHPEKFLLEGKDFWSLPKELVVQIECTSDKYKGKKRSTKADSGQVGSFWPGSPESSECRALCSSPRLFLFLLTPTLLPVPEHSILYDSIWSASEPSSSPPLLMLLAAEIRSQMRSLIFLGMHTFLLVTRCLSDSSFFSKLSIHCLFSALPWEGPGL